MTKNLYFFGVYGFYVCTYVLDLNFTIFVFLAYLSLFYFVCVCVCVCAVELKTTIIYSALNFLFRSCSNRHSMGE